LTLDHDDHNTVSGNQRPGFDVWELAKRWRLKLALIESLGKLKHQAAVTEFLSIIQSGREHHAVMSVVALALLRLNTPAARTGLDTAADDVEINTIIRGREGLKRLNLLPIPDPARTLTTG